MKSKKFKLLSGKEPKLNGDVMFISPGVNVRDDTTYVDNSFTTPMSSGFFFKINDGESINFSTGIFPFTFSLNPNNNSSITFSDGENTCQIFYRE